MNTSTIDSGRPIRVAPAGPVRFILMMAAALLPADPAAAEVIWRGDFETGTTEQWRGAPKSDGVKVVEEPVREGKYALRIDGTNAARKGNLDRIEFQHQPKPPGTAEGTERFFGWSVFLPKKFTDGHHSVGYFETRNSWSRLMAFDVQDEDIIYTTRVPYAMRWTGKGKLTAGRWHDFAVHVLWSRDPAKGFVEVWFDGENVVPRANTATLRDENVAFFQIGLFRDTTDVPETIIIDHVIEATTLAEVTPPRLVEKPAEKSQARGACEGNGPSATGEQIPPPRRIFAASGGIMGSNAPWPLMRYILSLTGKSDPVVVCLPTARGDHLENIVAWYEMMNQLPCRPRHLRLFGPTKNLRDFEQQLLSADVIFVQGGNTLNMLATWKAQGVDAILRKAWERGILLAGESAGMVCWFEQTVTDSRPGGLTPLDCLGWLKGSACPHYHADPQRQPTFHKLLSDGGMKDGVACDDGAGLLFEGDKLVKVITTSEKATAYTLRRAGAEVVEEPMKAELLVTPQSDPAPGPPPR